MPVCVPFRSLSDYVFQIRSEKRKKIVKNSRRCLWLIQLIRGVLPWILRPTYFKVFVFVECFIWCSSLFQIRPMRWRGLSIVSYKPFWILWRIFMYCWGIWSDELTSSCILVRQKSAPWEACLILFLIVVLLMKSIQKALKKIL